jgi:hypothetical protein
MCRGSVAGTSVGSSPSNGHTCTTVWSGSITAAGLANVARSARLRTLSTSGASLRAM